MGFGRRHTTYPLDDVGGTISTAISRPEPGGNTPSHRHPHGHEVFVVDGAGVFVHEAMNHPVGLDDVIFIPGGREHCFKNTGDATLRFLCLVALSGA